jgi:hypothetical protein
MSLKNLRYRHFCGEGPPRDVEAHSLSQQAAAVKAVQERMRAMKAVVEPSASVGLTAPSPEQKWQGLFAASLR